MSFHSRPVLGRLVWWFHHKPVRSFPPHLVSFQFSGRHASWSTVNRVRICWTCLQWLGEKFSTVSETGYQQTLWIVWSFHEANLTQWFYWSMCKSQKWESARYHLVTLWSSIRSRLHRVLAWEWTVSSLVQPWSWQWWKQCALCQKYR